MLGSLCVLIIICIYLLVLIITIAIIFIQMATNEIQLFLKIIKSTINKILNY